MKTNKTNIMAPSSDMEVNQAGTDDDLDFDLEACGAPSLTNSLYTNSDEEDFDAEERGTTCTVNSATYIPRELLMLPAVNHVVDEDKVVVAAKPEQPVQDVEKNSTKKDYSYRFAFMECGVCPRYIRTAPLWLKLFMAVATCTIFFGLSLYLGARILQDTNDDGSSGDKPASDIIIEQDAGLLQWQVDSSTMAPTSPATPSLYEWSQSLSTTASPPAP